ncbi:MAG: 7-cyano-7-deazaguanine synthase QueC [Gemmatimonadales bacterium]|jgi:7-cyano-7-deazaguanine synthase|nr:7-cyano-7-deazaguanine synthase QueC [Gemmatimonadales bacterium]
MSSRAVVLLSGGMDSATTAAIARAEGHEVQALSVRYGQRHALELEAARAVAAHLGITRHAIVELDLRAVGGSALTAELAVPKDRPMAAMAADVPVTYVPARNTIFLALALAWAETLGAGAIYIGATAVDFSGYPDCRPDFLAAFEDVARLGTRAGREGSGPRIHAPLITLSKADIVRRGIALGVDFGLTRTCYDPAADGRACGRCDACQLRLKGFREAGLDDPIAYVDQHVLPA